MGDRSPWSHRWFRWQASSWRASSSEMPRSGSGWMAKQCLPSLGPGYWSAPSACPLVRKELWIRSRCHAGSRLWMSGVRQKSSAGCWASSCEGLLRDARNELFPMCREVQLPDLGNMLFLPGFWAPSWFSPRQRARNRQRPRCGCQSWSCWYDHIDQHAVDSSMRGYYLILGAPFFSMKWSLKTKRPFGKEIGTWKIMLSYKHPPASKIIGCKSKSYCHVWMKSYNKMTCGFYFVFYTNWRDMYKIQ